METISIALVTRNRPESLERSLRSWRAQEIQPYEIVVSDDSDLEIGKTCCEIAARYDCRYFQGPRRGLYANRNFIAEKCQGTYILSADDDHEHPCEFMNRCCQALIEDPTSVWIIGEVMSWEDVVNGWGVPGELKLVGASDIPNDLDNTWGWSDGAALFPRRLFESGLRFCDQFRFGWVYLEFGCLVHALGYRIRVLRNIGVIHHYDGRNRSFDLPIEERAARYFAMFMFAVYYQRNTVNVTKLFLYFIKELIRRPSGFLKAGAWAWRVVRGRREFFRELREVGLEAA